MPSQPCPYCNGKGRQGFSKCVNCQGTGRVETPNTQPSTIPWTFIIPGILLLGVVLLGWRPYSFSAFGIGFEPPRPTERPTRVPLVFPTPLPITATEAPQLPVQPLPTDNTNTMVAELLSKAADQEIAAFKNSDASYVYSVYAGNLLQTIENDILLLNSQGEYKISNLNRNLTRYKNIRRISDKYIEVDTCEYWSSTWYRKSDGQPTRFVPESLVPQTLTIQFFDSGYRITDALILPGASFCS